MDYTVSSRRITCAADIEVDWRELENRADCSYFQSWGWIGCWLSHVAAELQPEVARYGYVLGIALNSTGQSDPAVAGHLDGSLELDHEGPLVGRVSERIPLWRPRHVGRIQRPVNRQVL